MKTSTVTAFLLASSAFLSLPALADTSLSVPNDSSRPSTDASVGMPKTRAQVKAELKQAQQDGSLNPVTHSTYPSLLPYARE